MTDQKVLTSNQWPSNVVHDELLKIAIDAQKLDYGIGEAKELATYIAQAEMNYLWLSYPAGNA